MREGTVLPLANCVIRCQPGGRPRPGLGSRAVRIQAMMGPMKRRILMGLVLAVALGGFAYTFSAPTQVDGPRLPAAVEAVFPEGGDLDLRQATIVADLAPGYVGYLLLDGVELPADQVRVVDGLNRYELVPDADSDLRELRPGPHCASVAYWPIGLSEAEGSSFRWCFRLH